jgi:hypothetical protein
VLVLLKRADSLDYIGDRLGQPLMMSMRRSNARNPGDFDYKEYLEGIDVLVKFMWIKQVL